MDWAGLFRDLFGEEIFPLMVIADRELSLILQVHVAGKGLNGADDLLNEAFPVYLHPTF
jgi:hypothetical protein